MSTHYSNCNCLYAPYVWVFTLNFSFLFGFNVARMLLWRIAREYWWSSSLKDVVGDLMIIHFLWKQTATYFSMLSSWLDEIVFRMNGSSSSPDHLYEHFKEFNPNSITVELPKLPERLNALSLGNL